MMPDDSLYYTTTAETAARQKARNIRLIPVKSTNKLKSQRTRLDSHYLAAVTYNNLPLDPDAPRDGS